MADWTSLRYAVVDVEGNGQQPPDLVEVAAVPIAGGVIGAPVSWLVRPPLPITPLARRIHGITNEHVAGAPVFADIRDELLHVLDGAVLVAHSAHVDAGVLARELGGWNAPEEFDTLKLARRLLPGQPSYRLGSLTRVLDLAAGLAPDLVPHRAAYDALVTARLFVRLAAPPGAGPVSLAELRGQVARGGDDAAALLF
jgi:DNA polymerase III epsilon subunit-like protein